METQLSLLMLDLVFAREAHVEYIGLHVDIPMRAEFDTELSQAYDEIENAGGEIQKMEIDPYVVDYDYLVSSLTESWEHLSRAEQLASTITLRISLKDQVFPTLANIYSSPVKTYIIAEDLESHDDVVAILAGSDWYPEVKPGVPNPYPSPPHPDAFLEENVIVVDVARPSTLATDFFAELADVEASGARLIIHIFSAEAGVAFIKQWGELEVNAVPVGMNSLGKMIEYWDVTDGYCEYETLFTSTALVQWQTGRMEVVWPVDQYYSKPWTLPPWMYPYSDVTYDGRVDIFDVVLIAKAFGSRPGDPNWK